MKILGQVNVLPNSTIIFTSQQQNSIYQCEIFGTSSSGISVGGSTVGVEIFSSYVEGFRNIIINSNASIRCDGSTFASNEKIASIGIKPIVLSSVC